MKIESVNCPEGIWFLIEEKNVPKPMTAIHAINGNQVKSGNFILSNSMDGVSFTQDQHIGFVRWFKNDLTVQKISISDDWNRSQISELLIDAANTFISSKGITGTIIAK